MDENDRTKLRRGFAASIASDERTERLRSFVNLSQKRRSMFFTDDDIADELELAAAYARAGLVPPRAIDETIVDLDRAGTDREAMVEELARARGKDPHYGRSALRTAISEAKASRLEERVRGIEPGRVARLHADLGDLLERRRKRLQELEAQHAQLREDLSEAFADEPNAFAEDANSVH